MTCGELLWKPNAKTLLKAAKMELKLSSDKRNKEKIR